MNYNRTNKTITFSRNTGISLTIGTLLFIIGLTWSVALKMANIEAKIAGIEAKAAWDARDTDTLVGEIKTLRQDLTATNLNVNRLSTQLEDIAGNRPATTTRTTSTTPVRTSSVSSPVSQPTQPAPKDKTPDKQPSPLSFLPDLPSSLRGDKLKVFKK